MREFESDGVNLMTVILDDSNDRQSVFVYLVARMLWTIAGVRQIQGEQYPL